MECIILAGGLGTRLRHILQDIPKPMAPICDKPFLHYLLSYLSKYNFSHCILSVGYKYEVIKNYFGNKYLNIEISYAIEEKQLLTGGAIKYASNLLRDNDDFFVFNGDTLFLVDLDDFYNFYTKQKPDVLLALKYLENTSRYGSVILDKDNKRVLCFKEKTTSSENGFINGGIYLLSKKFLTSDLPEIFSFEKDLLENNCKTKKIYGYVSNNYFIDIGIPEDYQKACVEISTFF